MIFLNPTILLGLLAASVPILIHLLNLQKLKKIEFSTLAFLKELQKTKIRKIKLKQWILLLLRVLIILLLVAAFARPTLESITLGGASSAAKTTAVFVIDNSFSMSVVADNGSYINQAKTILKSIVSDFEEGDDISIIASSSYDFNKKTELTRAQSINTIDEINTTDISGNLLEALAEASDIIETSDNFNKEIYLISDFQKSEFTDNLLSSFSDKLKNANTKLYTINLSAKEITNLAITDFQVNNQIFEVNKPIEFTANVTNYTNQPISNSIVSLFIAGKREAQQSVSLPANQSKEVSFNANLNSAGLLETFLELDEDDILQDNKRYLAINVPENISVLVLSQFEEDTRFIELVLSGNSFIDNVSLTKKKIRQISSIDFAEYNIVVLCGAEDNLNSSRLESYINSGGSLILFPSSNQNLSAFSLLCTNLNIPKPVRILDDNTKQSTALNIEEIDFNHPIFLNLFENESKKEIDSPEIYKSLEYTTEGKGKSILTLNNNSSFLSEFIVGEGKIFLFNITPNLSSSNFPLKGIFAPLISKLVSYLSTKSESNKNHIAGDALHVHLSGKHFPRLKIIKPDNSEEFITLNEQVNQNYYTYFNTEQAGIYRFLQNDELVDYAVVNGSPIESQVSHLLDDKFDELLDSISFKGTHIKLSPNDNFSQVIYQARFGTELWRYFLLAAFILALVEMFISKSTKKDLADLD